MDVAAFVALVLGGLLAGSELTSWAIVHPTLWKLDHAAQVRAEKLMYRRFATFDPFLMTATVAACLTAAGTLDGDPARLALAAGGCFAVMLTLTLVGNMPINLRVFGWDEEGGDPKEWGRLRRRWDRLHTVRVSSTPRASCSSPWRWPTCEEGEAPHPCRTVPKSHSSDLS